MLGIDSKIEQHLFHLGRIGIDDPQGLPPAQVLSLSSSVGSSGGAVLSLDVFHWFRSTGRTFDSALPAEGEYSSDQFRTVPRSMLNDFELLAVGVWRPFTS